MAKSKTTVYLSIIIVEGMGEFPLDMLRYDSCWPASEGDAHVMRRDEDGTRTVRLRRACVNATPPTLGRWKSFGWTVTHVDDTDARLL